MCFTRADGQPGVDAERYYAESHTIAQSMRQWATPVVRPVAAVRYGVHDVAAAPERTERLLAARGRSAINAPPCNRTATRLYPPAFHQCGVRATLCLHSRWTHRT